MKMFLLFMVIFFAFLLLRPESGLCVYCAGGTPCYSDVDCSQGCRCQAPPYYQGVCIPKY